MYSLKKNFERIHKQNYEIGYCFTIYCSFKYSLFVYIDYI